MKSARVRALASELTRRIGERAEVLRYFEADPFPSALAFGVLARSEGVLASVVDASSAVTGVAGDSTTRAEDSLPTEARALHPGIRAHLQIGGTVAPVRGTRRADFLAQALDGMAQHDEVGVDCSALVREWASLIVWLRFAPSEDPAACFPSAAFPQMPGAVFLSGVALYSVPPSVTWTAPSVYALQENLVHECLHHRLESSLVTRHVFDDVPVSRRHAKTIPVPWRGIEWTFEHALHAFYVYRHLAPIRAAAARRAHGEERDKLERGAHVAYEAKQHLAQELGARNAAFVPAATRDVVEAILMGEAA